MNKNRIVLVGLFIVLGVTANIANASSQSAEIDYCRRAAIRVAIKKHAEKYNDEYAPKPNAGYTEVQELDPSKQKFDLIRMFSIPVSDESGGSTWLAVTEAEPKVTKKGKKYCKVLYTEVGQEE